MKIIDFRTDQLLKYTWCGKFVAPSTEWIHMTRHLEDYELIVMTEGVLYIADEDTEYTVGEGQYLLMKPTFNQHGFRSSCCSFYWMHFSCNNPEERAMEFESIEQDLVSSADHIYLPVTNDLASSERILILMKQLQDSDKRYHDPNLNKYLTCAVLSELSNQSFLMRNSLKNTKEQLFNDIADYISRQACENLTVKQVSDYFGYNEKYLTTFFRMHSGIPLKQFILNEKIEKAKAQLSDTNLSVSQIAYSIGYNDVHNFSNTFKKITGLTPSVYRNSYNKRVLFNK